MTASGAYNGGAGMDTLLFGFSGSFDFTMVPDDRFLALEVLDLETNGSADFVVLGVADVLAFSNTTNTLIIEGNSSDTVDIAPAFFVMTGTTSQGGESYNTYSAGGATLLIDSTFGPAVV